ncbi:MAG: pyridoxal-phosphate dependent enzyme [Flavobacteriales bacterium]|nr:pyridoxal-phosphate dependent enzyme [Flavobacteriales bacterium]
MIVYTADVIQLVNACVDRYKGQPNVEFGKPNMAEFFSHMVGHINKEVGSALSEQTFYKQYYIRIQGHASSEIGYSVAYLNALTQYVHGFDYLDKFPRVEHDEEIPEFPWTHPSFPATPAVRFTHEDYTNIWVKDEGQNPCGIHKDRKAHEIYLYYVKLIRESMENQEHLQLPRLSLITSGFAGLSIQYRLRAAGLPSLNVLLDESVSDHLVKLLVDSRAEVHRHDLRSKELSSDDVKRLTENENGIDITRANELPDLSGRYYDWLCYEILNLNPDVVIVPYGSGELYRNLLEIHARELKSKHNSRRYFGDRSVLRNCHFIGARADKKVPNSMLTSLVSFYDVVKPEEISTIQNATYCGNLTEVYEIEEDPVLFKATVKEAQKQNIRTCPSGIAGLILLKQQEKVWNLPRDAKIVVVNTGTIREELFAKKKI